MFEYNRWDRDFLRRLSGIIVARWKARDPGMTSCIIKVQFKRNIYICIQFFRFFDTSKCPTAVERSSLFHESYWHADMKWGIYWQIKEKKAQEVQRQPVLIYHMTYIYIYIYTYDLLFIPAWIFLYPSVTRNWSHPETFWLIIGGGVHVILRPSQIQTVEKYPKYLRWNRLAINIMMKQTSHFKHGARAKWISGGWLMASRGRKLHFLMKSDGSHVACGAITLLDVH